MDQTRDILRLLPIGVSLLLAGCVLAPKGTKEERARIAMTGRIYQPPFEQRALPAVPTPATWQDVLHRAFLANGDLEASYFEWQAASARIDMKAGWPNSNLAVSFQYMFSAGNMKAFDRTTVLAQPDPAMSLQMPFKTAQAGQVAYDEARAAGFRFLAAKFELQRKVLTSYLDLALMEGKVRIQQTNVALLKLLSDTAASRVQAGGPQQDLLKAQIEWRLAENELANMESESRAMRAMLNGMLARQADAPLVLPTTLPAARPVAADDARLIAVAVAANPELANLAQQVRGRKDALELARMAWIPDVNPMAGFTGSVSQMAGAMVMFPTAIPMIRGQISESRSMLRQMEAMARQTRSDRAASFIAALYAMRNAERQVMLFQQRIIPAAEQVLASSRQSYAAGTVGFADLIDSQRTLLEARLMLAEARIAREKRLAEMESLAGVDVETLWKMPTTRPQTNIQQ